jgi:hypothetical protein
MSNSPTRRRYSPLSTRSDYPKSGLAALLLVLLLVVACRDAGPPELGDTPRSLTVAALENLAHAEPNARLLAARKLGELRAPEAVSLLGERLLTDSSWAVRQEAALALGRIGAPEGARFLARAVDEENPRVRQTVYQVLPELGPAAEEELLTWLERRGDAASPGLVVALAHFGARPAWTRFQALIKTAVQEENLEQLEQLCVVLPNFGAPGCEEAARLFAKTWEPAWRPAALALSACGEAGLDELRTALGEDFAARRIAACEGLARTGARLARRELVAALQDENPYLRSAAAYALGEGRVTPALGELLVASFAAHPLVALRSRSAVEKLLPTEESAVLLDPTDLILVESILNAHSEISATSRELLLRFYRKALSGE